jgi:putative ABC transport system permease protein
VRVTSGVLWLALRNLGRSRRRAASTAAGVAVGMFLFCALVSIVLAVDGFMETGVRALERVIGVSDRYGAAEGGMPQTHLLAIRRLGGVAGGAGVVLGSAEYAGGRDAITLWAVEPNDFRAVMASEVGIAALGEDAWARFQAPNAALVGKAQAAQRGWEVGDTVTLPSIWPMSPRPSADLRIVVAAVVPSGFFDSRVVLHRIYVQEATGRVGQLDAILAAAATVEAVPSVCAEIERSLAATAVPVRTVTASAFFSRFVAGMNLRQLVWALGLAALLAATAVTATTMAIAVRERTREIGVMRCLGFTRGAVRAFVLVEAMVVAVAGGLGGTLASYGLIAAVGLVVRVGPLMYFDVPPVVIAYGLLASVGVALAAGVPCAVAIGRVPLLTALRARP